MADRALPISFEFPDSSAYVESLLNFTTSSELFQTLCGGVHILDFFIREPDIYTTLLPRCWRQWFHQVEVEDVLDLCFRDDLVEQRSRKTHPPRDLLEYLSAIKKHSLRREIYAKCPSLKSSQTSNGIILTRKVAIGMKPKKVHEVQNFACFVDDLASKNSITHLVDFGSGQNYLGRTLASEPFNRRVIAIESRERNIQGAKQMDVTLGLSSKGSTRSRAKKRSSISQTTAKSETARERSTIKGSLQYVQHKIEDSDLSYLVPLIGDSQCHTSNLPNENRGSFNVTDPYQDEGELHTGPNYLAEAETSIVCSAKTSQNGTDLLPGLAAPGLEDVRVMIVSLHSCGNLIHHGLRALLSNNFVKAVALIGCCYNLVTERLGPPTYKLPSLRIFHARVAQEQAAFDPHGFPLSRHLETYRHARGQGIRYNITARAMAVQAPQNWARKESEIFFTRHFYRALLQRIFLDMGIIQRPAEDDCEGVDQDNSSANAAEPIILGSLRKPCYSSFTSYVRGAVAKLAAASDRGKEIQVRMNGVTDDTLTTYEQMYQHRKKDLSIVWSLMALSASLVEATIVVDRWLFLREQPEVKDCWVEPVFDYSQSPRNLLVVGVKR